MNDVSNAATGGDTARPPSDLEIELALDLQEPHGDGFEACVRNAMETVGGEVLFDVPTDGTLEDASRIAALRVPGDRQDRILFAILDETATAIRVADADEVGERFYGFAESFVGVLECIRADGGLTLAGDAAT